MAAVSSDCQAGTNHRRCISRIFGALLDPCDCFCHTAIEVEVLEVEEPGPRARWADLTAYMTGMAVRRPVDFRNITGV